MALAVVATALGTVTGATPSAQAQRPEGSLVVASTTLTASPASPTLEGVPVTFTATVTPEIPQHPGHRRLRAFLGRRPRRRGGSGQLGPGVVHRLRARTRSPHDPGPLRREQHVPPWQQSRDRPSGRCGPHRRPRRPRCATTTGTTSTSTTTTTTSPGQAQTSTELSSSANPSVFGQPVTFTATVTPGSAPLGLRWVAVPQQVVEGGSVTFSDGGTVLAHGRRRGWADDVHYLVPVSGCAHDHGDVRWHGYGGTEQRHDYPTGQRTSTADDATGLDSPGHPLVPPGDQRAHTCLDTLKRWCQEPDRGRNKVGCGHDHPSRRRKPRFC